MIANIPSTPPVRKAPKLRPRFPSFPSEHGIEFKARPASFSRSLFRIEAQPMGK